MLQTLDGAPFRFERRRTRTTPMLKLLDQYRAEPTEQLRQSILERGDAAIPDLMEVLELELSGEDVAIAAADAAEFLGELRATGAIDLLFRTLRESDSDEVQEGVGSGLAMFGGAVIERAFSELEQAHQPEYRDALAFLLVDAGRGDERVFWYLTGLLTTRPFFGALVLGQYGDPRAVPLLIESLEAIRPETDEDRRAVIELVGVIEELGGSCPPALQQKAAAARARIRGDQSSNDEHAPQRLRQSSWASRWYDPVDLPQEPFVRDEPKFERNEPCWCGSGKKYKKCHLGK